MVFLAVAITHRLPDRAPPSAAQGSGRCGCFNAIVVSLVRTPPVLCLSIDKQRARYTRGCTAWPPRPPHPPSPPFLQIVRAEPHIAPEPHMRNPVRLCLSEYPRRRYRQQPPSLRRIKKRREMSGCWRGRVLWWLRGGP